LENVRGKNRRFQEYTYAFVVLCLLSETLPAHASPAREVTQPDWVIESWEKRDRVSEIGYAEAASRLAVKLEDTAQMPSGGLAKGALLAKARDTYYQLAQKQREELLAPYLDRIDTLIFAKHQVFGGRAHYAYTEGLTDHPQSGVGNRGGGLYLLTIDENMVCSVEPLHETPQGILRDPDVSFDAKRILFSKRDTKHEDYHLFELTVADRSVRQITFGEAHADIEPAYLQNGEIVFNSTRCVQDVDCFPRPVSNFYLCDNNGRYIRRIGFDQVHTNYPTLMSNGKVLFTRWEYNDRKQYFTQCLFQMNPNGTAQEEFFGNNSVFPTSILHGREIPGTGKAVAILSGHHTEQQGHLAIIDPKLGDDGLQSITLLAPEREPVDPGPKGSARDFYAQTGDVYQYPYPLDEEAFLVSHRYLEEDGKDSPPFSIAFVTRDGTREVLATSTDPDMSCSKPMPLAVRTRPQTPANSVDYTISEGNFSIMDVYHGESSEGIERGTIDRIRVVGIEYRARSLPPSAAGDSYLAVAAGEGTWDVKVIIGEAEVYDDGSAWFTAPVRMPLYFQLVDTNGYVAQTMRSWTVLQPGEGQSCVGCHEKKDELPPARSTIAQKAGPKPLNEFHGPARGFSFQNEIQPVLDQKCVSCHDGGVHNGVTTVDFRSSRVTGPDDEDLLFYHGQDRRKGNRISKSRFGPRYSTRSYWNLIGYVSWINGLGPPELLPPYLDGSFESDLIKHLDAGHNNVELTREERDKLCCWIDLLIPYAGDYMEGLWEEEAAIYQRWQDKRNAWLEIEEQNILDYIANGTGSVIQYSTPDGPRPFTTRFQEIPARQSRVYLVNPRGQLIPQMNGKTAPYQFPAPGVYLEKSGKGKGFKKIVIDE